MAGDVLLLQGLLLLISPHFGCRGIRCRMGWLGPRYSALDRSGKRDSRVLTRYYCYLAFDPLTKTWFITRLEKPVC